VHLKSPKLTDRLRNSVGSEFQTVGHAMEEELWTCYREVANLFNTDLLYGETGVMYFELYTAFLFIMRSRSLI